MMNSRPYLRKVEKWRNRFSSHKNGGKVGKSRQKCVNHENPEFLMSNCQNKASSYVTCLKCVCFYSKTMTRYFHNYPKVLCTFQILSEEMKIGRDLSPAFQRYAPVVNYLTFAIPQSGSLAWMAGVAFPGEKFHIFHGTIFFHRSPLMHPSKCSPL